MDAGKKPSNKLPPSTMRSSPVTRDTPSLSGKNPQPCNKPGCSSRLNRMKSSLGAGYSQKAKSVRSFVCLSGGKEVSGSSSKNTASVSATRSAKKESQKKIALHLDTDSSESSSVRDELEVIKVVSPPGKTQKGVKESPKKGVTVMEIGSSSSQATPTLRSRSSISRFKSSTLSKAKSVRQQPANPNTSPCNLRNLSCNTTADVILSSNNTPQTQSLSKRKVLSKGRASEGEPSTSRGKKKADETLPSSSNGVSISESRTARNSSIPDIHRSIPSIRVQRSTGEGSTRSSSSSESQFTFSGLNHRIFPVNGNDSSNSSSPEWSNECGFRRRPSSPDSLGITSRSLLNWEIFQPYSVEGIAEVLSALERIERDELHLEQLVSLETNLFLNRLNVFDQHRDMRMDIDNMSYEELLALGERMGTVTTPLTEEALSKCVMRESYRKTKCDYEAAARLEKDETKCSICQEEYMDEDEVGRLQCEHMYHVDCINQWLRLKNWCPICKGSAETSSSSPGL